MRTSRPFSLLLGTALLLALAPAAGGSSDSRPSDPADYWTSARRAAAVPRDLVVGPNGEGYLRLPNGRLQPYGSSGDAEARGKPGGDASDNQGPIITDLQPTGTVTTAEHLFSAFVTDPSGVRSVTFHVTSPGGTTTSYAASGPTGGGGWSATVTGLTTGTGWSWTVEARDGVRKGGGNDNTASASFSVELGTGGDDGGGGGTGGDATVVTNEEWATAGVLQTAVGRIYFEMRSSPRRYSGYVCSGTVARDGTTGRSIILTAAHCVYDDAYKEFARNVLFIPAQDQTTASGTNRTCTDDLLGCWKPSWGVVDSDWADRSWPDNIPWDYAYYVVEDVAASFTAGFAPTGSTLDVAAGSAAPSFTVAPIAGNRTHALGYSYSDDPNLMYCAEGLASDVGSFDPDPLWLGSCGLSGGASGGPWIQPMGTDGSGPIISVNSYGYSNSDGMGGPHLFGSSASCLFEVAKTTPGSVRAC